MNNNGARLPIIESLILSSPEPLSVKKISEVVENVSVRDIDEIIDELNIKYTSNDLSFRIRKIAGGYQSYIIEDYARYVEDLFTRRRTVRLTRAALETLAIIAYRQPVTKANIELIRGVASDSVIHTLLDRKLITLAGRADTIGKPLLYKTTNEFLKFFNLNAVDDLPKMEEIEELLAADEPLLPQTSLPLSSEDNKPTEFSVDQPDPADEISTDGSSNTDSSGIDEESSIDDTTVVAQAEALLSEKSRELTGDGADLSQASEKEEVPVRAVEDEEIDKAEIFEDN
jgi:segregation and condensation protein B